MPLDFLRQNRLRFPAAAKHLVNQGLTALPAIEGGLDRYHDTVHRLTDAAKEAGAVKNVKAASLPGMGDLAGYLATSLLGNALGGVARGGMSAVGHGLGARLEQAVGPQHELGERKDPMGMLMSSLIQGGGKGFGEAGGKLLGTALSSGISGLGSMQARHQASQVFQQLIQSDPQISQAYHENPQQVQQAWDTITRFAPTIASDVNGARSYLRQAIMSGSGPDPHMIQMLADAERSVRGDA